MADKNPNRIISNLAPKTLRERWNAYFNKGMGSGSNVDFWNNEIAEIEKGLPFENEEEHKKWIDLGSTYMGGPEYPALTEKILDRLDNFDFNNLDLYEDNEIYETDDKGFVTLPKKYKGWIQEGLKRR